MTATPPTTIPHAGFKRPDKLVDENLLAHHLAMPITADTFSALISSNFLMIMDAYDHRCQRDCFQDLVIIAMNFQNRLVRLAEMKTLQANLASPDFTPEILEEDIDRHMISAMEYQRTLQQTLALFREMRLPGDPVC
jgi:hypothetical protein